MHPTDSQTARMSTRKIIEYCMTRRLYRLCFHTTWHNECIAIFLYEIDPGPNRTCFFLTFPIHSMRCQIRSLHVGPSGDDASVFKSAPFHGSNVRLFKLVVVFLVTENDGWPSLNSHNFQYMGLDSHFPHTQSWVQNETRPVLRCHKTTNAASYVPIWNHVFLDSCLLSSNMSACFSYS